MKILGKEYRIVDTYDRVLTVPDCFVLNKNQLGKGHGEKKFYFASKEVMREFFGEKGFNVKCFFLKEDLIKYLNNIRGEYIHPSQDYVGREEFSSLWKERMNKVMSMDDFIYFNVQDQVAISGPRGYLNSSDDNYNIMRELSLPLVSYISIMKVALNDELLFYWKLFVDFDAIAEKQEALVFTYGKGQKRIAQPKIQNAPKISNSVRKGQDKFRAALLEECTFCPITMVNEERLLVASHIKPWAVSNPKEKVDPNNGFMLSPLYDALFDKGFITFTDDRHMIISNWLSPANQKRLNLKNNEFYQRLPINEKRKEYLEYHRNMVFKG